MLRKLIFCIVLGAFQVKTYWTKIIFNNSNRVLFSSNYLIKLVNPSIVALALFKRLLDPSCFAKIFLIPANSSTRRLEPPAITPDPGVEGFKIIVDAQNLPFVGYATELD